MPHDEKIIAAARQLCVQRQKNDASGHSHHHSFRVHDIAVTIQAGEGKGDLLVIRLAALLHDVNDKKLLARGTAQPIDIASHLCSHGLERERAEKVVAVISQIDFAGAIVEQQCPDIETAIVMDADRLDAIGAIGIARVFAYGGAAGRDLHDPEEAVVLHDSEERYRANTSSSINHFYEKLLLLKERMNTAAAKKLADGRHAHMEAFLEQFFAEWRGER